MKKADVIKKIKAIINTYGEFTTADVEANSSPVIANSKHTQTLAEEFGKHKVTGIEYFKDEEWNQDYYSYEELTLPVLKEILVLAETLVKPFAITTSDGHDETWEYYDSELEAHETFIYMQGYETDIHLYKLNKNMEYEVIDSWSIEE